MRGTAVYCTAVNCDPADSSTLAVTHLHRSALPRHRVGLIPHRDVNCSMPPHRVVTHTTWYRHLQCICITRVRILTCDHRICIRLRVPSPRLCPSCLGIPGWRGSVSSFRSALGQSVSSLSSFIPLRNIAVWIWASRCCVCVIARVAVSMSASTHRCPARPMPLRSGSFALYP